MGVFVLKKYEEKTESKPEQSKPPVEDNTIDEENDSNIYLDGDRSVAEIVAKALYKSMGDSVPEIKEVTTQSNPVTTVKTVTTEQINTDPVAALNRIKKGDKVYIQNEGFKTKQEEWFLMSMEAMGVKLFLTPTSLVKYLGNHKE